MFGLSVGLLPHFGPVPVIAGIGGCLHRLLPSPPIALLYRSLWRLDGLRYLRRNHSDFSRRLPMILTQICVCILVVQHRLRGSAFSHVSDHTYVDVSGRREPRAHFRAVHVAEGLIARAGHLTTHGIRVYLVIAFGDALCLWEYNPDQYEVRYSGVMDEKTPKIKSYVSVPLKFLSTIITKEDADRESKESHEAGIHHVQAVQQVAAEDAGRDHPAQQEEGQEAGQGQGQEA